MAAARHHTLTTPLCHVKLLLKTSLTIFIFVQFQANVNVSGTIYKTVRWFANNPRFIVGTNDQNCKEDEVLEMRVKVGSKLTFLCPTPVTVFETMQHDVSKESLYENLWIAYDKENFDTCTVSSTSKYLLACNNPDSLKYLTVYFNIYSASHRLEFPHEKYYYFFSTSDGTVGSLNHTAHGHCNDTQGKVAMKFRLFFCWENSKNPKCNDTNFPFGEFRCAGSNSPTSTQAPNITTYLPTPNVAARGQSPPPGTITYLAIGLGVAFAFSVLLNVALFTRYRRILYSRVNRRDEEDGGQLSNSKSKGPPPSVSNSQRAASSNTNKQDEVDGSQPTKLKPKWPPPSVPEIQRKVPNVPRGTPNVVARA